MTDQKQLAMDLSAKITYEPMDDRILVKPMKPVMITKLVPTPPKDGTIEATTLDEVEKQEPTDPTKMRVEANIQRGVVIKLGPDYTDPETPARLRNLEIGDIVIYPRNAGVQFELLKDSRLLRRYELIGKVRA